MTSHVAKVDFRIAGPDISRCVWQQKKAMSYSNLWRRFGAAFVKSDVQVPLLISGGVLGLWGACHPHPTIADKFQSFSTWAMIGYTAPVSIPATALYGLYKNTVGTYRVVKAPSPQNDA
jgi:hypothetical protein